jgi:hypothetical protein
MLRVDLLTLRRRVGLGGGLAGCGRRHRRSCQARGLWQRHRPAGMHVERVERHSTARVVLVLALATVRQVRPVCGVVECLVAPDYVRLVDVVADVAFCFPPLADVLFQVGPIFTSVRESLGALAAEPGTSLVVTCAHVSSAANVGLEMPGADGARVLVHVPLLGLVRRVGVGTRLMVLVRHGVGS